MKYAFPEFLVDLTPNFDLIIFSGCKLLKHMYFFASGWSGTKNIPTDKVLKNMAVAMKIFSKRFWCRISSNLIKYRAEIMMDSFPLICALCPFSWNLCHHYSLLNRLTMLLNYLKTRVPSNLMSSFAKSAVKNHPWHFRNTLHFTEARAAAPSRTTCQCLHPSTAPYLANRIPKMALPRQTANGY